MDSPSDRGTEQGRALHWCGKALLLPLPVGVLRGRILARKDEFSFIFCVRLLSAIISGILLTVDYYQNILEGNSDAEYQVCCQAPSFQAPVSLFFCIVF